MNFILKIEPTLGSLEEEYRQDFLGEDINFLIIVIVITNIFVITMAYNDYLF